MDSKIWFFLKIVLQYVSILLIQCKKKKKASISNTIAPCINESKKYFYVLQFVFIKIKVKQT